MVKILADLSDKKTFKRETALLGLIFWAMLTGRVFWGIAPEHVDAYQGMYGAVTSATWLFAGAAFGLDQFAKKWKGD